MIYEQFFNLKQRPFSIAPNPDFLYGQGQYQEALAALQYGLHHRGGFVLLTGEVGTGKTTLCRQLLSVVPVNTEVALVLHPQLDRLEFLQAICREFDIEDSSQDTEVKLIHHIHQYLLSVFSSGKNAVLVIDEAQHLDFTVLELVRLLTNLETQQEKLLQIILIGQPELKARLDRYDLRQLNQRITVRYHLSPLSPREVVSYVCHRMRVASGERRGQVQRVFSISSLWLLHRLTKGIPRLINVVADRALMAAYAENQHTIGMVLLYKAAKEVLPTYNLKRLRVSKVAASSVLLIAGVGTYFGLAMSPVDEAGVVNVNVPISESTTALISDFWHKSDGRFSELSDYWQVDEHLICVEPLSCWQGLMPGGVLRSVSVPLLVKQNGRWEKYAPIEETIGGVVEAKIVWRPPYPFERALKVGDQSKYVGWVRQGLQRFEGLKNTLQWEVIAPANGAVGLSDDVYDFVLEEQVRQFQKRFGLVVDGLVGSQTLIALWLLQNSHSEMQENSPQRGLVGDL